MKLEETEYIKVRDAEVGETGWAYISNGSYVLDNDFERIPHGSILELEKDGYTIKNFVDRNKLDAERREREHKEEMARQNKELHKYIGKHVKTRQGIGEILRVEGTWAIAEFEDGEIKHYTLSSINDLLKDNKII
ncbi:hypothetical protein FYM68_01330 [Lactobacillus salivarius]|uniref:hypothetical protein n=1 Tax=Ligilactobacillus salivarius TaxID=1624 RepID=UPI00136BF6A6|nr:hypothetical protein [Ligilactobacillus salivarius]MYU70378.1 hypothetical protein [Ligilactobacillus salivarius]MYZ74905.1 hypothetical protein [Ligilactobacillus salivarius]UVX35132.1 MAG: hypothetical protein [Bacteriophage sp.]